jgi:hypothetical protein
MEKPCGNQESKTYPRHPEVPKYASSFSTLYTSISYLGRTCVAVHLGQLELCGGAYSRGEAQVADDVTEGLSRIRESAHALHIHNQSHRGPIESIERALRSNVAEKSIRTSEFRFARRPSVWYDLGGP